jgi:hypothetical protein
MPTYEQRLQALAEPFQPKPLRQASQAFGELGFRLWDGHKKAQEPQNK